MNELLIEKWFPIYEANIESGRERAGANMMPPLYYFHLWWARRPLAASRITSVLAALSSDSFDEKGRKRLLWALGLKGDPIEASARRVDEGKGFGYPVLEGVQPEVKVYLDKMIELWDRRPVGADFMAGGGAIPFEMIRSGFGEVVAGEYNPIAYLIMKAALEYSLEYGNRIIQDVERYGRLLLKNLRQKVEKYYPRHPQGQPVDYIWVRIFHCPECGCEVPALKTLWLDRRKGYAFYPVFQKGKVKLNVVKVEEVEKIKIGRKEESRLRITDGAYAGTIFETRSYVKRGKLECPLHTVAKDVVKVQYKEYLDKRESEGYHGSHPARLVAALLKGRTYVEPTTEMIRAYALAEEKLRKIWDELVADDLVPLEMHDKGEADRVVEFGIDRFYKMFNARQLLVHAQIVRQIREIHAQVIEDEVRKGISRKIAQDYAKAIATYLTLTLGKTLDFNSALTMWNVHWGRIVHTFDTHAFAWTWDFAEGDMIHEGKGLYEWALKNSLKALKGIVKRLKGARPSVKIVFGDAQETALMGVSANGYDVVFMDPPYYGNVQYGEISDYFYVWFKRTLKNIYPEVFIQLETPKQEEAVANRVRHGSQRLAAAHYEKKMQEIFTSIYKGLKDDGVFLLWFAHKTGVAWSKTIRALLGSGFNITAMWGVRSEFRHSIHITGKAALKTSIIIVCRKRENGGGYIQDVMRDLDRSLELRLTELDGWGIMGPDFLMSAQAEALRVTSQYWPVKDPSGKLGPEEILDFILDHATGQALNYITRKVAPQIVGVDAPTKFYILAKHLYTDLIPYDDARRLALACLGASGITDPVLELVTKTGLGQMSSEQVRGERAKIVKLAIPWERVRKGTFARGKTAASIDWIHLAVTHLEEGKSIYEAAEAIAQGGPDVCEALTALYHILPDQIHRGRTTTRNREKLHVKTLFLGVCQERLHLIIRRQKKKEEIQKRLEDYVKEKTE